MKKAYDVVIVGYGPVGATLANSLGKKGLSVAVLEQNKQIVNYPRAIHIDEETLRVFASIGLEYEIRETIKPFQVYQLVDKHKKPLFEFVPDISKTEGYDSCHWIIQPEIERVLREGVERFDNVDIMLETKVIEVEQDEEKVRVQYAFVSPFAEEDHVEELECQYLIAADGGRSTIRRLFDFPVKDYGNKKNWLVVDSYYHGDNADAFTEIHQQICNPARPTTFVNGVGNHFRWEFMLHDHEDMQEFETIEAVESLLAGQVNVKDFDIFRFKTYTFHNLVCEKWREKRVFLMGDAAHLMPPFLGQGMCSGIKDVRNLDWKLACVLQGMAPESLLDTYFEERKEVVTNIIKTAMMLGKAIQFDSHGWEFVRNAILRVINSLPQELPKKLIERFLTSFNKGFLGTNRKKLTGTRFPQTKVVDAFGHHLLLDYALGERFTVLHTSPDLEGFSVNNPFFKSLAVVPLHSKASERSKDVLKDPSGKLLHCLKRTGWTL